MRPYGAIHETKHTRRNRPSRVLSSTRAHGSTYDLSVMGWVINPGDFSNSNAESAAIRQISHEVLKTFDPQY